MREKKLIRDDLSFPTNSDKAKDKDKEPEDEDKDRKKLEPIVKGTVIKQKKSFFKKAVEMFIGDESTSVKDYIVYDILVPTIKNTITDVITSSLEMTLFGERRSRGTIRDRDRSYVSYNSYSSRRDRDRDRNRPRERSSNYDFDDILFDSRTEAEDVLARMEDEIRQYDVVTVADLYDLCGITTDYVDHKHGWTDLRDAHTNRTRNGYTIRFPRTRPLD